MPSRSSVVRTYAYRDGKVQEITGESDFSWPPCFDVMPFPKTYAMLGSPFYTTVALPPTRDPRTPLQLAVDVLLEAWATADPNDRVWILDGPLNTLRDARREERSTPSA